MTCQIPAHVHLNPFPYIPFYMIVILDSNTSFLSIYFLIPLVVQLLSCAQLFAVPWTEAHQASLPFTLSQSLLKLMSIASVMPSNHLILSLPSPPALNLSQHHGKASFPVSQLFASGGQSIGASVSVLPMNIQAWFPLGLTGLISLQSKGLSRVVSGTTGQKHQFFGTRSSLCSNSHIITWLLEKP